MSAAVLLSIYCAGIVGASLLGGFIPHWFRLTHTRMQTALSFVAGAMLGVGLLHLIPHAFLLVGSIDRTMWFALAGFLLMFFIERAFHFHHHDAPPEPTSTEPQAPAHDCDHEHHKHHGHSHGEHTHAGHDHGEAHGSSTSIGWGPALLGLGLHSLLDGVALAAGIAAERSEHHDLAWAGLAIFLVIALHKPLDSLTLGALMAVGGRSVRHRHLVNFGYALSVPIGALLFQAGLFTFGAADKQAIGCVLALAAGTFLCISTSDLLPELQFHSHNRLQLSLALVAGLAIAGGIVFLEQSGHDHSHVGNGRQATSDPSGKPAATASPRP
ncbi:MAG: ZIP family metal transporter [Planctomycetia bacterium]|nr:ZIP family metal transporter [Planctomycetia bacterium]